MKQQLVYSSEELRSHTDSYANFLYTRFRKIYENNTQDFWHGDTRNLKNLLRKLAILGIKFIKDSHSFEYTEILMIQFSIAFENIGGERYYHADIKNEAKDIAELAEKYFKGLIHKYGGSKNPLKHRGNSKKYPNGWIDNRNLKLNELIDKLDDRIELISIKPH